MENDAKELKELAQEIENKAGCLTDLAVVLLGYVEGEIKNPGGFYVLADGLRDLTKRAKALNKELL